MQVANQDFEQLSREHRALMHDYGQAQTRCSEQLRAQAREIGQLHAQAIRLRGQVIVRETALAWARQEHEALEQAIPGLPRRVTLARRVDALLARIQDLMRERLRTESRSANKASARADAAAPVQGQAADALEASLRAADLVICQTGCLSHGAFWRVQDHCKRTGKPCVLVEKPEALRIVRIHAASGSNSQARVEALTQEPGA